MSSANDRLVPGGPADPDPGVAAAARGRGARWARWGWLATTVALGAAVILTGWSNLLSVREASTTLYSGQNDLLMGAVAQQLRGQEDGPTPEALSRVLTEQAGAGLRYLAVYGHDGVLQAHAGMPAGPVPQSLAGASGPPGPRLEKLPGGGRIRATMIAPPHHARDGEPQAERRRRRSILIEFEPLVAERLAAHAARALALGVVVSLLLMAAAAVFWRMSQRHEEVQRRLEHQRRLSALGEMSAVLAHEIRNPLASLKGHAQLLAERLAAGSAERSKADRVVHEATRLETLAGNLLEFARSGAIHPVDADPAALLRGAAVETGPDVIDCAVQEAPTTWRLDEEGMRRTLANVLRNAVQSTPPGARVEASVSREHDRLVYTVHDHGPGFAPGQIVQLFDPFYTTRATGTGLGLAVAQRIVQMHGGTIRAENAPGGGARVRISIPEARS
jgi:two-component system, NtrC family, sensor histidine kinase HydH